MNLEHLTKAEVPRPPRPKSTSWQVVMASGIVAIYLGAIAFGIWLIWSAP